MLGVILSVTAVSGIAAGLAALLVIAGRIVSNYGECRIVINDDKVLKVDGGSSLLESLTANEIFIPSACGGKGTCAYCKVRILDGAGPLLPTEEPYLDTKERQDGVRLSCQVKVKNDLRIEIPAELLEIQQYTARCSHIRELTPDIREFRFELQDPPEITYTAGQYIQLLAPTYDGNEEVYRAYSISSDPSEKNIIELVIRLVPNGICTTWCFNYLHENDPVSMNGPYGEFKLSETDAPMIFVAGGSGIAPIKCILHHMKNTGNSRKAVFYFGANEVQQLFYLDEMRQFEEELADFTFVPCVSRPEEEAEWGGEVGLVTDVIERGLPDASGHEAYLCGSPGMIDAAVQVLRKAGVKEHDIFYDKFA